MATDIVQSLFGVNPESYRQQQQQQQQSNLAEQQAMEMSQMDPLQRASYNIGRSGYQLGGALGGALGGQDPELQKRSQRQALLGMIDPSNSESYVQAIQAALQSGDTEAAYALRGEMMNAKQREQQSQQSTMQYEDYLTNRGLGMQTRGLEALAQELIGQLKNADGTINEKVKLQLMSFPQGQAAISQFAKLIPDLRRIGASGAVDDPFKIFADDATISPNVKTLAAQYSKSFTNGILDPEKADEKLKSLVDMQQRIQQYDENQANIKSQQDILNGFKEQGLANSTAALNLQRSIAEMGAKNTEFQLQLRADELTRRKEEDEARRQNRADELIRRMDEDEWKRNQKRDELEQKRQAAEDRKTQQENELARRKEEDRFRRETKTSELEQKKSDAELKRQQRQDELDRKKEEAANKPLRADLAKEEDADYALAKDAKNLATDAYSYINRIKTGDIKFGFKDRASISTRNVLGSQDPDVIARNDYDQFIKRLTNDSLRLNKGTQTEGDAQRALAEVKGAESAADAARAMSKLVEINARRVEDAKASVERRRKNAGFREPEVPIELPKFEPHIITPNDYNSFLKNPKYPSGTVFVDPQGVRRVKP
jgi:hypothetical protein